VISRLRASLFSFQTKLILAMTSVIVLAIFLAGAVFVVRDREERREEALARVASASPAIYQQSLVALLPQEQAQQPFAQTLNELAEEQDTRILILTRDGVILHDTGDRLTGRELVVPQSSFQDLQRGFIAWEPGADFPESDITLVSASSRFVTGRGIEFPFRIVLAVESDTIADAWLSVLPGLGLAALVAALIATLGAGFLARQVAQPVRKLTAASEAVAAGDFSQRVEVDRDDEIGRLARSFSAMAGRVGERDAQMRALLANVSHDLKTPMTSITGYAQSLNDGTAAPEDAPHIGQIIEEEAQHVNRLLGDLLYLSEIDAGQVITRREDVPLNDVVERCVRRIEPAARASGIDVSLDVAPGARLYDVDPEKLERALTNVLDNAAKFTPHDGSITVRGWSENGARPPVTRCAVTNTGPAIPEEDLPRVFDRFFRGDRSRRSASGSGLGLAITRELVELNRGDITVRNEPVGSVTFTLTFPHPVGG
jgi:signal transduction histidine kinase